MLYLSPYALRLTPYALRLTPSKASRKKSYLGFSQTELLISLAVVGLIVALVISPIINHLNQKDRDVKHKAAISTIQEIIYSLGQQGAFTQGSGSQYTRDQQNLILSKFNAATANPSHDGNSNDTNGCWTSSMYPSWQVGHHYGCLIQHNGTHIAIQSWNESTGGRIVFFTIDVNGPKGPNTTEGDDYDAMTVVACVVEPCLPQRRLFTVVPTQWTSSNQSNFRKLFRR